MTVLARVTEDLEQPRGPDVMFSVEAPSVWFVEGASIEVLLPRLLSCARCEGGGCDVCERRGGFEQASSGAPSDVVVTLPEPSSGDPQPVRLRLPGCGARAASLELPNGHLLLTVLPRPIAESEAGPSVRKLFVTAGVRANSGSRIWAVLRSLAKLLSRWPSR